MGNFADLALAEVREHLPEPGYGEYGGGMMAAELAWLGEEDAGDGETLTTEETARIEALYLAEIASGGQVPF